MTSADPEVQPLGTSNKADEPLDERPAGVHQNTLCRVADLTKVSNLGCDQRLA